MERLAFFPWNQRERDSCFGCDLAINGDNALCLPHGLSHDGSLHDEGGFDAHGIAGQDHFAEASAFDACEDRIVGLCAAGRIPCGCAEAHETASLCDGFNVQNAGHDWLLGEVPLEKGFVDGYVFDGNEMRSVLRIILDLIDEEEGVAVGKESEDTIDSERRHKELQIRTDNS